MHASSISSGVTARHLAVASSPSLPRGRQGRATFLTNTQRLRRVLAGMRQRRHDHNVENGLTDPPPFYRLHTTQQERDMMVRYVAAIRARSATQDTSVSPAVPAAARSRHVTQWNVALASRQLRLKALRLRAGMNHLNHMMTRMSTSTSVPIEPPAQVRTPAQVTVGDRKPKTTVKTIMRGEVRWQETTQTRAHPTRPRATVRTLVLRRADDSVVGSRGYRSYVDGRLVEGASCTPDGLYVR